ncbi:MAG: collagenase-like protease [Bacteroidetes bacterium CG23_combo_of_CG06-09_8_20_14_all_32_9]|nr:MAG: collagenase-like protease [Bacteroidetes bacterium CG23_combo_of_CG06-09_8_20_14_all_32_9]
MRNSKPIEIMSPVGSYETLMAAIQGGASSVYFGVGHLNMRSKSTYNFSIYDLNNIVNICNENNVKSYLTVNIVIYDSEITEMQILIRSAKQAGVTAIIASDMAVLEYGKKIGIEIHASTQLNISNFEAVKFYARYCDVIILARELTIEQITLICKQIDKENICAPSGNKVRIEVFVHGALCMSISGKCYLSLHQNNNSANRGRCLQNCRHSYTVTDKESGYQLDIENDYIMSPKDLCTIHILDKILDAGVTVLKIEGRARSPEYVKIVTGCYHQAVEAWKTNNFNNENIELWLNKLKTVYNRGFWEGYYLGAKLGEWTKNYGSSATKQKIYIGKVTNFFKNISVAEILIETGEMEVNDNILIIGPSSGVVEHKVNEIRLNDKSTTNIVQKGSVCSIVTNCLVRRNDKVYKWINKNNVNQPA